MRSPLARPRRRGKLNSQFVVSVEAVTLVHIFGGAILAAYIYEIRKKLIGNANRATKEMRRDALARLCFLKWRSNLQELLVRGAWLLQMSVIKSCDRIDL